MTYTTNNKKDNSSLVSDFSVTRTVDVLKANGYIYDGNIGGYSCSSGGIIVNYIFKEDEREVFIEVENDNLSGYDYFNMDKPIATCYNFYYFDSMADSVVLAALNINKNSGNLQQINDLLYGMGFESCNKHVSGGFICSERTDAFYVREKHDGCFFKFIGDRTVVIISALTGLVSLGHIIVSQCNDCYKYREFSIDPGFSSFISEFSQESISKAIKELGNKIFNLLC
jgi:hypothetical protein